MGFKDPTTRVMVKAVDGPKKVGRRIVMEVKTSVLKHSQATNNEQRADIGVLALIGAGFDIHPNELPTSITDLVADLLHLARQNDIEPDCVISTTQMHFDAEVEEEAEDGKSEA